MIWAPSTFSALPPKLQTRVKSVCQRLLTVGKASIRGVLERGECFVLLQSASEVLSGLSVELVELKTANESRIEVSAAANTFSGEFRVCERTSAM